MKACAQELGFPYPVSVSRLHAPKDADAYCHWVGRELRFGFGPVFWESPPAYKRLCIAHEFGHGFDRPVVFLVCAWKQRGAINARMMREYERREEKRILVIEKTLARLLPEWDEG